MSDIPKKLEETGKWSENTAWLSERAGHKCEYCGLDFFASVANYRSIQIDHIIPLSKGGKDMNDNKAISCRTCNVDLKSRWNPAKVCDSKDRDKLIEAVRKHIEEREKHYLDEIELMKSIVNR
jgi:5-methylcytosine-specific restriction endonuclease McrA